MVLEEGEAIKENGVRAIEVEGVRHHGTSGRPGLTWAVVAGSRERTPKRGLLGSGRVWLDMLQAADVGKGGEAPSLADLPPVLGWCVGIVPLQDSCRAKKRCSEETAVVRVVHIREACKGVLYMLSLMCCGICTSCICSEMSQCGYKTSGSLLRSVGSQQVAGALLEMDQVIR
ncbi:hypothetical protein MLD38_000445 [Melastoma candidum]|uniref:Uncharacterized protein n=1 Tax=Melastoma candidum TaxID=119954 RepID=A0ACB9S9N6_9MYRT|nr:hypothetical protein MLD38_000445 [Melastoma candidum]